MTKKTKKFKKNNNINKQNIYVQQNKPIPISTPEYVAGLFLFLVIFGIYTHTVAPTISFSDSGDFITCAYTLGIAHPTGYPTWTMLAHLFTYIPISNIAMRVNLLSCVFGAMTCMIIFFCLIKLLRNIPAAISGACILAFSFTLFRVSQIAEVYSLYAFFVALSIFIIITWKEYKTNKLLYTGAFIYGLSFTNHLLIITIFPAIIYLIWITRKDILLTPRILCRISLFFFIGLLPYSYLIIRGFQCPLIDWGEPTTIESFFRLITGKIYKDSMFKETSITQVIETWKYHLYILTKQFTIYLVPFIFIGLWKIWQCNAKLLIFCIIVFVCNTTYSLGLQKVIQGLLDHESYHMPSYIIMNIVVTYGIVSSYQWLKSTIYKKILSYIACMLPLFPLITYYHQADMSKYFFAHDYGMNVLRHLPTKTILFNQVDYNVFPLWYLQYVENVRKDIPVFSVLFLTRPWYVERMLKIYPDVKLTCNPEGHYSKIFSNIIYNNIKEFKIYFTHDFATQKDPNALMPANAIKEGILYTLKPQKIGKELPYIYRGVYDTSVYKDVWAYEVIGVYGYYYAWLGQEALQQNQYKEAIKYLNKALELDKNNASYYPNLALAYNSIQKYDDAISILEDAIELHPDKHELLYHLALTYYYKKEYDKSILYAEKALMNNLDDVQIYNLLGICYYLKGKRQKAVKIFQKSLKINPHLEETKKYLYMTQQDMIKKSP